ncbi:sialate O-acetylesterase [Flavicella sediminum]|uniref:sialate O-acetylesterase n=1 Tax=Flavicella sediminum TaxID=2585141 RepID=UPI00140B331A|nr:sialate O-acetylesterase [Flavicella sediminum]
MNPIQVVLLAGQSNMAGGGNYDALDISLQKRIEKIAGRVLLSENGNAAKPLSYRDSKPTEKRNFTKKFGPELLVGLTLAEKYPNQEFLLIKRSQGGTALYGAWNPKWDAEKAKAIEKGSFKQNLKLHALHLQDIEENLNALKKQNRAFEIFGMVWMQGENDAILEVAAKNYRNNLRSLVRSYRTTLKSPEMPFVFGQINSRYGVEGGAALVRLNMQKFANGDYYSKLVETSTDTTWTDFPKHLDNVHYNAEGLRRLGIAFANSFFEIQEKLEAAAFKSIDQLLPGKTGKFKAEGETNMIYHVYTPTNFNASKKLPIIVSFSPNGKGDGMLAKMKSSAEKMGWILVGCDQLRNGMKDLEREKKMEDEVLDAIFKNIPHDKNKIYLAGFSGGAMRAYNLTTRRKDKFAGIIAYGGWLGGKEFQDLDYQDNLKVAMVNGLNDKGANKWNEIDEKTLKKHNAIVKMFRHSGGHQVAPAEVTDAVLNWLNEN